ERANANDEETGEQNRLEAQGPARRPTAPARCFDNDRGHDAAQEKKRNPEHFDEKAGIMRDELSAGDNKASGNLSDEQSKQAEEGAAVDAAGSDTKRNRNDTRIAQVENRRGRTHDTSFGLKAGARDVGGTLSTRSRCDTVP